MLWIIIIIVAAALYFLLRGRRAEPGYGPWNTAPGGSGLGYMAGGMLLGYLLSNNLINQQQYDEWKNMNGEDLKNTLTDNGIVSAAEFDSLSQQFDDYSGSETVDDSTNSPDYGEDDSNMSGSDFDDFGDF